MKRRKISCKFCSHSAVSSLSLHGRCVFAVVKSLRFRCAKVSTQKKTKRKRCLSIRPWDPSLSGGNQKCGLGIHRWANHLQRNSEMFLGDWFYTPPVLGGAALSDNSAAAEKKKLCAQRTLSFIYRWRWIVKKGNTSQHLKCIKISLPVLESLGCSQRQP